MSAQRFRRSLVYFDNLGARMRLAACLLSLVLPLATFAEEVPRPGAPTPLAAEAIAKKRAAVAADQAAQAATKAYQAARKLAIRDYFQTTADLSPIVVKVPDNPSKEQLAEAKRQGDLNQRLTGLREWRAGKHRGDGEDDALFMPAALAEFAHVRGVAWLLDL